MEDTLISVVICTFNSAETLSYTLDSLNQQKYSNIEIIVVDRHSEDLTSEIAEAKGARVYQSSIERSTQKNYGASHANGKYLYFVDGDMVTHPKFISRALIKCEEEELDAIITSVITHSDNFWGKCKGLEREIYIGEDLVETARFLRKDVFLILGGWDEDLVACEDYDLQNRLNEAGYRTGRGADYAEIHLGEATSLKTIFFKNLYYGKTMLTYIRKYPMHSMRQFVLIRPAFNKQWRKLFAQPLLLAGLLVMKVVQYAGGGLGLAMARWQENTKK